MLMAVIQKLTPNRVFLLDTRGDSRPLNLCASCFVRLRAMSNSINSFRQTPTMRRTSCWVLSQWRIMLFQMLVTVSLFIAYRRSHSRLPSPQHLNIFLFFITTLVRYFTRPVCFSRIIIVTPPALVAQLSGPTIGAILMRSQQLTVLLSAPTIAVEQSNCTNTHVINLAKISSKFLVPIVRTQRVALRYQCNGENISLVHNRDWIFANTVSWQWDILVICGWNHLDDSD